MAWLLFHLDTSADLAGRCEEQLLALGAVAVTLADNADQPIFHGASGDARGEELALWRETRVSGLFPATADTRELWQALGMELQAECRCRSEILEDKDWEREWMQHYQPLQYGDKLWVCPSWLQPPDPGAVNIMLDPGLAFGTGTHPTTTMCLQLLATMPLDKLQVVDYGCGSGVLAIAALLLGARSALAVDNDPQALVASRDNALRNGIDLQQLDIQSPEAAPATGEADLVVANILAGPLCELAPVLCRLLLPGGTLLLSGVLTEQAEALQASYREQGVNLFVATQSEGWIAMQGQQDG